MATSPHSGATPASPASPSEAPPEVSTLPAGSEELLDEPAASAWRKVPAPAAVTDTNPVEDAGVADAPPAIPTIVKVLGFGAIAMLLAVAGWLGMTLGQPATPPAPAASPSPSQPGWPLEAPAVVGQWVQGDAERTDPRTPGGPAVVRATYKDGKKQMALVLSRPESDARDYLANAGIVGVVSINDGWCGTQADSLVPVCAQLADQTGIMLVGLSKQSQATLIKQLGTFATTLSGR